MKLTLVLGLLISGYSFSSAAYECTGADEAGAEFKMTMDAFDSKSSTISYKNFQDKTATCELYNSGTNYCEFVSGDTTIYAFAYESTMDGTFEVRSSIVPEEPTVPVSGILSCN